MQTECSRNIEYLLDYRKNDGNHDEGENDIQYGNNRAGEYELEALIVDERDKRRHESDCDCGEYRLIDYIHSLIAEARQHQTDFNRTYEIEECEEPARRIENREPCQSESYRESYSPLSCYACSKRRHDDERKECP